MAVLRPILMVALACVTIRLSAAMLSEPKEANKSNKKPGTLGHMNHAIEKGDVKSAAKDLTKLEKASAEKATQTEQAVLSKVAKESRKIKKLRKKAKATSKVADTVAAKRKKNPKLHATAEAVKRTKAAIRNAKVADAQHAVARLSRKDAENQVVILHQRERQDETKVKAAEHTAAKQKAKGDAAVAKLSKELQAEKIEVKHAKAEAAAEMKKSQKADKAAKKNKHLTKKQIKVRNEATKHVQKAKARVAHGYAKMKHAENNAAVQVHHYEKIKNKLMHTEANEMKSKQVESQKLHALSKAKTIEQQQELKLKAARKAAAKETRSALYAAFGKDELEAASPLRKELAAALSQEKQQAKQLASLEQQGFQQPRTTEQKLVDSKQCNSASNTAKSYDQCHTDCVAHSSGWFGAKQSCTCFHCRPQLEAALQSACSCDQGTANYNTWCPKLRTIQRTCTSKCVDENEKCTCGHTPRSCCAAHGIACKGGFFWQRRCHLGHPLGYTCELRMTSATVAFVIVAAILMAAIMYGCIPTVLAWYCCIRQGSQLNWLFGGTRIHAKDDDL